MHWGNAAQRRETRLRDGKRGSETGNAAPFGPPGARKERHCQVLCVSDTILSIIGKSRLSLTFLPKTIMAPNCHFGD